MFSLARFVHLVKVAAWGVFLFAFPPLCFANGMYAAAAVLSVLGLLLDVTELGALLPESTPPKMRRGVVATVAILHVALLAASVVRLVVPNYGPWKRVPGTEGWNNPSLVRAERGPLLAVGGVDVFALDENGNLAPVSGIEGPVHALGAGARRAWFVHVEGNAAWGYDGASITKVPLRWAAASGGREGAALDDALFVVRRGALVRVELDGHESEVIERASITSVATVGTRVVAVGAHVFVSEDGGRRFVDRGPHGLKVPDVFAGGDSYYLVQSGIVSSRLFVSEAGRGLEERKAPARDIRILSVDPRDGRRVWLATWGEGVWRSEDGGRTWQDLELEGVEMHSLVVDFSAKGAGAQAWVAATNLATPSGIFHHVSR